MPVVVVRKTTYDSLAARHQAILRRARAGWGLTLGDPAVFRDAGGVQWYVWDDPRLNLEHVALVGAVAANWALFPASFVIPNADDGSLEPLVRSTLGARLVPPSQVVVPNDGDAFTAVLTAQNAPASLRAFGSVPADWVAV